MTDMEPTIWSKDSKAWGSARRVQRNCYAYAVTMVLTGGKDICPTCLGPFDLDSAEVDRPNPPDDYRPGNCIYICHDCNHGRGILQSDGRDWSRVTEYQRDVIRASQYVGIPPVAKAKAWWQTRHGVTDDTPRVSRYA